MTKIECVKHNGKPYQVDQDAVMKVLGMDAAQFAKMAGEIFQNYPEAGQGCALSCHGWKYGEDGKGMQFHFYDEETDLDHHITEAEIVPALAAYITLKLGGALAGITVTEYNDAIGYDADSCDAIAQIACLGEVIYG